MVSRPEIAVEQQVTDGRLDEAVATLVEWFKASHPGRADDALLLAAEASNLRDAERRGELSDREGARLRLRLAKRILALRSEACEGDGPRLVETTAAPRPAAGPAATRPVFMSYHHGDRSETTAVAEGLRAAGIGVRIDEDAMQPGQDIAAFVHTSVAATRATVCIVSRASLSSGWVVQETLLALSAEALSDPRAPRAFVALYLDADFLDPAIRLELTDAIDARLGKLQALRAEHERRALGTEDLDGEIVRTRKLRNELGTVLQRLRTSLCLDLREPARAASLARLVAYLRQS